jgi:1-acyl-sn-glycerol-3-phosphate acyltransferase
VTVLRSALFNLLFFGLTFILSLYGTVLRFVAPGRVLGLGVIWTGTVLAALRQICGIRTVLIGGGHLPACGPALIAEQHQSAYDTLVWMTLLPRPAYVLKQELTRIPLFGPLLLTGGMIAVDRSGGAASLRRMLKAAGQAVADRRQIIIFPQGTRVEQGRRVQLLPGIAALAAQTGLPVIPVATDSGRRWGRRAFRKTAGPIHILVMPPLPAGLPRKELMERIESAWTAGTEQLQLVDKSVS